MKKNLSVILTPFIAPVVAILDLLSKKAIFTHYPFGQPVNIWGNFLRFTFIYNEGVVFGILNAKQSGLKPYLLTAMAAVVLGIVIFMFVKIEKYLKAGAPVVWARAALMLVAGGAVGNNIDRLFLFNGNGKLTVLDFIDNGIGNVRWFVYNLADAAIVVGSILLMILFIFFELKPAAGGVSNE